MVVDNIRTQGSGRHATIASGVKMGQVALADADSSEDSFFSHIKFIIGWSE